MIKPITFQGCVNFDANLYAVEVRSRFIDQTKANGYYRNYGEDIAASVIAQSIRIGTGAFLVQGRMVEITAAETVTPEIHDGFVGYVIAHVETYHPADEQNVTLIARVNRTLDSIVLTQNNIYANTADNVNTVYELPIYSFRISGTTITDVVKLIKPIEDYATVKKIADDALKQVQGAVKAAEKSAQDAETATGQATAAGSAAKFAQDAAEKARTDANEAVRQVNELAQTATDAANLAERTAQETEQTIKRLEQQIGEKQGTTIRAAGDPLAELNLDEAVFIGGNATGETVEQKVKVTILVRQDTAENWSSNNIVLKKGEWGYDTTNKIVKLGDGVTSWNDLSEIGGKAEVVQGKDGKDGTTFTPSVSDDGTLSWTNDGQKENPSPVNIMGPAGPVGPMGPAGPVGPAGPAGGGTKYSFAGVGDYWTSGAPRGFWLIETDDDYYYVEGIIPAEKVTTPNNTYIAWPKKSNAYGTGIIQQRSGKNITFGYGEASLLYFVLTGYEKTYGNTFSDAIVLCLSDGKVYNLFGMGSESLEVNKDLYNKVLIPLSDITYDTGN